METNIAQSVLACVFDLDGTLVDTLPDFHRALASALAELGRAPIPPDAVATMVGKGNEHLLRCALLYPRAPQAAALSAVDAALLADLQARFLAHYRRINGRGSRVFPGVLDCLQALQAAHLPLACLTNKPLALAQDLMRAKGLHRYFPLVFGGDSFARKKPDPLPLLRTCEALGQAPAAVLMVGDSSNDAAAARAAGCPVALVGYGYNHGRPIREVAADLYLQRLDSLPSHLGLPLH